MFSYETLDKGQRKFLIIDIKQFFVDYFCIKTEKRHVYEVIKGDTPCRLYLDVEYCKISNPSLKDNNKHITVDVIDMFKSKIQSLFKVDKVTFLILDSTTNEKYSKHVIFSLYNNNKELLFQSNKEVGKLVNIIIQENLVDLDVMNKQGIKVSFVDKSVYSVNRVFRIFGSSKYGKATKLSLDNSGMTVDEMIKNKYTDNKEELLSNTFVIPFDIFTQESTIREVETVRSLQSTNCHLINFFNYNKYQILTPICESKDVLRSTLIKASVKTKWMDNIPKTTYYARVLVAKSIWSRQVSWLPSLDVENIGGIKGIISSWIFDMSIDSDNVNNNIYYICYQIDKDRYCHNIGRHHKSNRIMYEVNLVARTIIQKCWDEDCKGYKSPSIKVPVNLIPGIEEIKLVVSSFCKRNLNNTK